MVMPRGQRCRPVSSPPAAKDYMPTKLLHSKSEAKGKGNSLVLGDHRQYRAQRCEKKIENELGRKSSLAALSLAALSLGGHRGVALPTQWQPRLSESVADPLDITAMERSESLIDVQFS